MRTVLLPLLTALLVALAACGCAQEHDQAQATCAYVERAANATYEAEMRGEVRLSARAISALQWWVCAECGPGNASCRVLGVAP